MAKDYTSSLNLPKTAFPMRGALPQREPDMLKEWEAMDLYHRILNKNADKPLFILHDGPPFSNGNIHMGTTMNKVLKDFITKNKMMSGYKVPFTPGWDNHGMPIESAIIKQNKLDRKKMSIPEFRTACEKFAAKYIDIQRNSFKRLGVLADWENPYTTMAPAFEAEEVTIFGKMFEKGYIYKDLKPVHWCNHCVTALAEAEIEYADDSCTSIWVKFALKNDNGKLGNTDKTYFIIWTTTTWTLPGNLAIALHPRDSYALVKAANGETYIVAEALAETTMKAGGIESYEIVATYPGSFFEYMTAQHPFLDRDSLLVTAEYVTMDSGTGCVHTAPGFGADDFVTGRRYKLATVVPVDDNGYQTEEAGKYAGLYYEESNKVILADMKESGALFASNEFTHSYPHCWRCKKPIIFRATPQWFCSVDAFKDAAIKACEDVTWNPSWGGERISQMIRDRADWCISRQRHWGLPIPVFYCEDCKKPICDEKTIARISEIFGKEGSNAWYKKDASELIPEGYVCPHCGGTHFFKETDTLDGWFDSGSSHFVVLKEENGQKWPADLYLEGGDHYRGWFKESLLSAVGAKGEGAPFKEVLTHGWVVDGEGKAMHKSIGNVILPEDMIKKYGADLVRLWVASSDYRVDVRVSDAIFAQLSDAYRKIRNTARIILANIGDAGTDFNPDTDMVAPADMLGLDKWALTRLNRLIETAQRGYQNYEFHVVSQAVINFCTTDMSKLYIDITKDRVYVEKKDSFARRSAQSALYLILSALTRLIAPILTYTANEIWKIMPHKADEDAAHVLLNDMPTVTDYGFDADVEDYNKLFALRDDMMKALELARADKKIGKSLDAKITVYVKGENKALLDQFCEELTAICIVSSVTVAEADAIPEGAYVGETADLAVLVEPADGEKCDRCWMYVTDIVEDGEGRICRRCKKNI
ncbi:MAG: isoleucine--tRNA ligase [Clostridia bacterium]|nr:isoleucine--tRNA ligase [Clostridia bacterium]